MGDVVAGEGHAGAQRKHARVWIPVDSAESLLVFESKDDAVKESNSAPGQAL